MSTVGAHPSSDSVTAVEGATVGVALGGGVGALATVMLSGAAIAAPAILAAAAGFGVAGATVGALVGAMAGSDTAADLDAPVPQNTTSEESSHV